MVHKIMLLILCLLFLGGCSQRQAEPAPALESEQAQNESASSDLEARSAEERASMKTNTGIMPSIAEREQRAAAQKESESSLFNDKNQLYADPSPIDTPLNTPPQAPSSLFKTQNEYEFGNRELQISSPKNGSQFRYGTYVSVSARAQNPRNIRSVIFYANNKVIGRTSRHPYRCKWYVRQRGPITIQIVATTMQNTTLNDTLNVFVDEKDLYMDRKYQEAVQEQP